MTVTNEERNARLLLLASFLDTIPTRRFGYGSWVGSDWEGREDLSCGTTACALGWATTIPELRALGLRLYLPPKECSDARGFVALASEIATSGALGVYDSWASALRATEAVFGLDEVETNWLFVPAYDEEVELFGKPDENATAREVAAHIRKFVAEGMPEDFIEHWESHR